MFASYKRADPRKVIRHSSTFRVPDSYGSVMTDFSAAAD